MKGLVSKILMISAGVIVLALVTTLITLSIVKVNFDTVVFVDDVETITVYANDSDNGNSGSCSFIPGLNGTEYNEIIDLYNKGTKESILVAWVQGALSSKAETTVNYLNIAVSESTAQKSSEYVICFDFEEARNLVVDGKTYNTSSTGSTPIEYQTVYVQINNSSTLSTVTAYIFETGVGSCTITVTFIAQHSDLYSYLTGFDFKSVE